MSSVFFVALRRLRAPLILIIVIFSIATVGLSLIPGVDENGQTWRMTPFQAFYFTTYTATTIGFGETPRAFTDAQRLWVTFVIYLSVVGWTYLLGSLMALAQDKGFQQAIVAARFRRNVRALRLPFYIICGLGETGLGVLSALDRLGFLFVVIDSDLTRLNELQIRDHSVDAPALVADARTPAALLSAGLKKPECRGLLALTNNDDVNLAIAINVYLLRPGLSVICRSQSVETSNTLKSLGGYQIIDPFEEFSDQLLIAMQSPDTHRLLTWLVGPPGNYLKPRLPAPPGAWIVCGYGRFGARIVEAIRQGGFAVTVIDPAGKAPSNVPVITGAGSEDTLLLAGVGEVAGVVAATDNDAINLSIAISARRLNPGIFVIARQNLVSNEPLFAALAADMTMVSNQIIANECVAMLRTPLLAEFLRIIRTKNNEWSRRLVRELGVMTRQVTPDFWSFTIGAEETPALFDIMSHLDVPITVGDLRRNASQRDHKLKCRSLLLQRGDCFVDLPADDSILEVGDRLLFAGAPAARNRQRDILLNANVAKFVLTGEGDGDGALWRWLRRKRRATKP